MYAYLYYIQHINPSQVNQATFANIKKIHFDTDMSLVSSGFVEWVDSAKGTGSHEALDKRVLWPPNLVALLIYPNNEDDMPLLPSISTTYRPALRVVQY